MNTTNTPTWSKRDERDLQDLLKRKQAFDAAAHAPVLDVAIKIKSLINSMVEPDANESLVSALINYADDIRDALEPFDSGVRVAQSDSTSG